MPENLHLWLKTSGYNRDTQYIPQQPDMQQKKLKAKPDCLALFTIYFASCNNPREAAPQFFILHFDF
jgi:hypothetical protein